MQITKYYYIALIIFGTLVFTNSASADSYTYACNDGGTVVSVVDINPTGPFVTNSPTLFTATGYIMSSCTSRQVNLTAKNNDGTVITLIPDTTLAPGSVTPVASTSFTSPAPSGTYKVTFNLGVEDIATLFCPVTSGLEFIGHFRHGKVKYNGPYLSSDQKQTVSVQLIGTGGAEDCTIDENGNNSCGGSGPIVLGDTTSLGPIVDFQISGRQGAVSYYKNTQCVGIGCEIDGTTGFDHGEIIGSTCTIMGSTGN